MSETVDCSVNDRVADGSFSCQLDVNQAPIPDHYIFRRLLNVKGNIEQDKTPVQLRDLSQAAQDAAAGSNGTAQKREEALLPDARYLALHAAIGGVLVKSGAVFYVIRLFEELKKVRTFASDGSSNVVHLLASHSIGKVCRALLFSHMRRESVLIILGWV